MRALFFFKKSVDKSRVLCYTTIRRTKEPTHPGEEGEVAPRLETSNQRLQKNDKKFFKKLLTTNRTCVILKSQRKKKGTKKK